MTERQELGSLEAMLFAHAEPVETARLADALRLDADEVTTLCLLYTSCVVEGPRDIKSIERTHEYNGLYLSLIHIYLPAGVEPAVFYRQRLEGPCFSAFHCVDDLARRLAAGKAGCRFRRAAKGSGHNQGRKKGHQGTGGAPQKMSCCCCADCQLSCAWLLQILVLFCGAALRLSLIHI